MRRHCSLSILTFGRLHEQEPRTALACLHGVFAGYVWHPSSNHIGHEWRVCPGQWQLWAPDAFKWPDQPAPPPTVTTPPNLPYAGPPTNTGGGGSAGSGGPNSNGPGTPNSNNPSSNIVDPLELLRLTESAKQQQPPPPPAPQTQPTPTVGTDPAKALIEAQATRDAAIINGTLPDPSTISAIRGNTLAIASNVPEADTLVLLGVGLACISLARRRVR
jgi:hypothetical protein